jgi:hypothetical protein
MGTLERVTIWTKNLFIASLIRPAKPRGNLMIHIKGGWK